MSVAGVQTTVTFGSANRAAAANWFQPQAGVPFNIFISGSGWVATIAIVRSPDGGVTWVPVALPSLASAATFTAPDSFIAEEPDPSVLWAASCLAADGGAWTSGAPVVRIG